MRRIFVSLFIISAVAAAAFAQNVRNTDYSPDKALKSNARVNPSTLAMELSIPLGGYAGRAGSGLPVSVSYSSKVWQMENVTQWPNNLGITVNDIRPLFAKRTAAGWTSSLGTVRIDYQWDKYEAATQGAPDYDGQIFAPAPWEEPPNNDLYYVKRVQVTMPDGATHEFRASDAPIGCGDIVSDCTGTDFTGTFLSVDGSRMRLESGSTSSTLYLPDGGRYLFGSPTGNLNLASTFYDRHGNMMTYAVVDDVDDVGQWTDTMGRVVKDPLPLNYDGVQHQTTGEDPTVYPGFGGADNYEIGFTWDTLSNARLDTGDALRYIGWKNCSGEAYTLISPYLFSDGGELQTRICNLGTQFNPVVLTKVTLPNGQFYEFKYNVFGEITKIIYPSGGYERFVYGAFEPLQAGNYAYDMANRGVTARYISVTGDGSDEVAWTYSATRNTSPAYYYVQTTAPDSSYTRQYLHQEPIGPTAKQYGFTSAFTGRPYDERAYSTSGDMISRKLTVYEATGPLSGGHSTATRDLRRTKEVSITIDPTNAYALATMTETAYDTTGSSDAAYFSSLNAKQVKKYHYIAVSRTTAEGTLTPATAAAWFSSETPAVVNESDYVYDSNYKARNITGLVSELRVEDASGNVKAKTQISYDDSSHTESSSGTMPSAASGSWADPTDSAHFGATVGLKRGNPTIVKSYYDIANSYYIQTESFFDQYGNLRKARDGRGNDVTTVYDDAYAFVYPTSVTTPVPDPTGTYGLDEVLQTATSYDYNTGLPDETTDPNGAVTKMAYEDPLLRPTKVTTAYGTSSAAETITEYGAGTSASTRWVKGKSQIDATNWKEAYTWFDGLGRTIKSQSVDAATGDVFVETEYDNMSRAKKVTNPYRTGDTIYWTENTFDTAGRPWKVTTPDGAVVETLYSRSTSGDIGTVVTVKDQALKERRSITNALGQLKRVDEPSGASGLGAITAPYQPTAYGYDLLNNLTTVTQIGDTTAECGGASSCTQTRTFSYDAMSRLKSAANPESGTISYTYDANSNLATKSDARSITTTYAYDALNRVKTRTYSDSTPAVSYYYDNLTNAKGKLIRVANSISTTEYTSFDILGRVTGHKQTTDGGASGGYTTAYAYNLAGALIEETYPSTRKVQNVLNSTGDLAVVQSKKNSSSGYWHYADSFAYNAVGAVTSMQLGNGHWESITFNSRLQPTQIALGTTPGATHKLDLDFTYNTSGNSDNNGNVLSQTITVPGLSHPFTQSYSYDELNRLKSATETYNGSNTWKQTYIFDRYGNRRFDFTSGNTTVPASSCAEAVCNPTISPTNNRLTSSGYSYDASGDTTYDAALRKFTYDGENKQVKAESTNSSQQVTGTLGEYSYDGDGKRVKKTAGDEVTIFVYDAAGKLVAEYSTIVESTEDAKVAYTTTDHLGSPRINTDANGATTARHDYLPYGEEITSAITSQRGSGVDYGDDTVRKKFTGYERDGESELDYAKARYHNFKQGRFCSPDPLLLTAKVEDPQTWNRYSYSMNNPLRFTDPTGMFIWSNDLGGDRGDEQLRADEVGAANTIEDSKKRAKAVKKANERVDKIIAQRNKIRSAISKAKEAASNLTGSEKARVQNAINAYGDEGKTNKNVVLGQWNGGGSSGGAYFGDDGKIFVMLGTLSNERLAVQFAHEGSHVADFHAFLNGGIDSIANITVGESERAAWTVAAYAAKGLGMNSFPESLPNDLRVWNKGWSESQIAVGVTNRLNGGGYVDQEDRMHVNQQKNIALIKSRWSSWY